MERWEFGTIGSQPHCSAQLRGSDRGEGFAVDSRMSNVLNSSDANCYRSYSSYSAVLALYFTNMAPFNAGDTGRVRMFKDEHSEAQRG